MFKCKICKRMICKSILDLTKCQYLVCKKNILNSNYLAPIFILFLINHKQIKDGITIIVVKIKKIPQSPFSQSTRAPDDEARVVLPAVPRNCWQNNSCFIIRCSCRLAKWRLGNFFYFNNYNGNSILNLFMVYKKQNKNRCKIITIQNIFFTY